MQVKQGGFFSQAFMSIVTGSDVAKYILQNKPSHLFLKKLEDNKIAKLYTKS